MYLAALDSTCFAGSAAAAPEAPELAESPPEGAPPEVEELDEALDEELDEAGAPEVEEVVVLVVSVTALVGSVVDLVESTGAIV
jgi:hypothetical protein